MIKAKGKVSAYRESVAKAQHNAFPTVATADKKYESIKEIAKRFDLDKTDVKQLFGISKSTQFRYEKQNSVLKVAVADRLERFSRIAHQALDVFEDEAETKRWLSTPKTALSGETPLMALATDAGAKKVEAILYRAEYGMFG